MISINLGLNARRCKLNYWFLFDFVQSCATLRNEMCNDLKCVQKPT